MAAATILDFHTFLDLLGRILLTVFLKIIEASRRVSAELMKSFVCL